jgi:hypothetical protein
MPIRDGAPGFAMALPMPAATAAVIETSGASAGDRAGPLGDDRVKDRREAAQLV